MTWQVFEREKKGGRNRRCGDAYAVVDTAHDALRFSAPARALIGAPTDVLLVYDLDQGLLGIQAATGDDHAYRLNPASGHVSIRAFLIEQGLDDLEPGRRQVHITRPDGENPILYVHLKEGTNP